MLVLIRSWACLLHHAPLERVLGLARASGEGAGRHQTHAHHAIPHAVFAGVVGAAVRADRAAATPVVRVRSQHLGERPTLVSTHQNAEDILSKTGRV